MADLHYLYDLIALDNLERLERRIRQRRRILKRRRDDLRELDDVDFKLRYKFSKSTVKHIIFLLRTKLSTRTTQNRAMTPEEKVLIALKYYTSGSFQAYVGDATNVSQSSVSRAVNEVSICLAELRPQFINSPQNESERREVSESFYSMCGFPGVIGALDCTHIQILKPVGENSEQFKNSNGFYSLNVQTLSDAKLSIRNIVVRWPGATYDSTIFDNSRLKTHLQTEVPSAYHVLGDNGYPLRPYLMTPFLNPSSDGQRKYNAAHALGRSVVERQHNIWKERFPCLSQPLRCALSNAQAIIVATAVLHNIAIDMNDEVPIDNVDSPQETIAPHFESDAAGVEKRNMIVDDYFS